MKQRVVLSLFLPCALAIVSAQSTPQTVELVPLQWMEADTGAPKRNLPTFRQLAPSDPRVAQAERMADNEAARFIRRVIAVAHRIANPRLETLPPLPIAFERGGNYARSGFYLSDGTNAQLQADTPYMLLDLDADRLSLTLLHEGGHVADRIVRAGARTEAEWSGVLHSTFAVTDRITALSEGFATHLETLWGHYGSDPARRAWYHRLEPAWRADAPIRGEFFAPVRDIMTFSQNWARYSAVRDSLPVFEGHVYEGDYLRSQYDPARDRSRVKSANALVASEGVVASTLFWMADGHSRTAGAQPQRGLDQQGLVEAESRLLTALRQAARANPAAPIDIVDVVASTGVANSSDRRDAIERFVAVTRGVTAAPEMRPAWRRMYLGAVALDLAASRKILDTLEATRARIVTDGLADPATLRKMTGTVLPVRLERASLRLVALGEPFPAQFDLNAAGLPELHLLTPDRQLRDKIDAALDQAPFASYADFESRIGVTLTSLGAAPVKK